MNQVQSSHVRPTVSLRRKKIVPWPPINRLIPERQDEVVMPHKINMETPYLLTYGSARESSTDVGDSEEELQGPIKEGLVDLSLLKSFRTHIVFSVLKDEVTNFSLKLLINYSLCIFYD